MGKHRSIRKIVGKKITGVVAIDAGRVLDSVSSNLFLIFDDGTSYELYTNSVTMSSPSIAYTRNLSNYSVEEIVNSNGFHGSLMAAFEMDENGNIIDKKAEKAEKAKTQ